MFLSVKMNNIGGQMRKILANSVTFTNMDALGLWYVVVENMSTIVTIEYGTQFITNITSIIKKLILSFGVRMFLGFFQKGR